VIRHLKQSVQGIDKAIISVHCHNDLGLAVANSLAAVIGGARQVECTINVLVNEPAMSAMEEIVMALRTRRDFYQCDTQINTQPGCTGQQAGCKRHASRCKGIRRSWAATPSA